MDHQYMTSIRGQRECFFTITICSLSITHPWEFDFQHQYQILLPQMMLKYAAFSSYHAHEFCKSLREEFQSYLRNSCPVKAELSLGLKCNGNANRGFNGTSKRNDWSLNKKHIRKGVFHFEHNKITILEMKVIWSQIKQNHGVYLFITIRLALSHGYLKWYSLLGSKVWRTLSCIFLDMAWHWRKIEGTCWLK